MAKSIEIAFQADTKKLTVALFKAEIEALKTKLAALERRLAELEAAQE